MIKTTYEEELRCGMVFSLSVTESMDEVQAMV